MIKTFLRRLFGAGSASLLAPGAEAPAFRVLDQDGELFDSASLAGERFVLWFYPKAATPG